MPSILGIIPARYASTRFPGKPLALIQGMSMLERVYRQSTKTDTLSEVIIATDDERIVELAESFQASVVMTGANHPSGTDRCYEAYSKYGKAFDYVLNIQGDEPFLHPRQIDSLALACDGEAEILTQMIPCTDPAVLFDKGEVKIVLKPNGEALYFSRSVIPHIKNQDEADWVNHFTYYRHVGMYAYKTEVLKAISILKPSALELAESLEQLRWLENGFRIRCVETDYDSHCIDTPEDIEKVLRLMNREEGV
ncbi:MAG TPA: 3-deoxy-manno-octulosonate cytidylyltransferase [Bacteroidia bacterium]|nr:3-deoxy-manno-octulosonate cytidylyltransferase [Bacteroidia bacterium]